MPAEPGRPRPRPGGSRPLPTPSLGANSSRTRSRVFAELGIRRHGPQHRRLPAAEKFARSVLQAAPGQMFLPAGPAASAPSASSTIGRGRRAAPLGLHGPPGPDTADFRFFLERFAGLGRWRRYVSSRGLRQIIRWRVDYAAHEPATARRFARGRIQIRTMGILTIKGSLHLLPASRFFHPRHQLRAAAIDKARISRTCDNCHDLPACFLGLAGWSRLATAAPAVGAGRKPAAADRSLCRENRLESASRDNAVPCQGSAGHEAADARLRRMDRPEKQAGGGRRRRVPARRAVGDVRLPAGNQRTRVDRGGRHQGLRRARGSVGRGGQGRLAGRSFSRSTSRPPARKST